MSFDLPDRSVWYRDGFTIIRDTNGVHLEQPDDRTITEEVVMALASALRYDPTRGLDSPMRFPESVVIDETQAIDPPSLAIDRSPFAKPE